MATWQGNHDKTAVASLKINKKKAGDIYHEAAPPSACNDALPGSIFDTAFHALKASAPSQTTRSSTSQGVARRVDRDVSLTARHASKTAAAVSKAAASVASLDGLERPIDEASNSSDNHAGGESANEQSTDSDIELRPKTKVYAGLKSAPSKPPPSKAFPKLTAKSSMSIVPGIPSPASRPFTPLSEAPTDVPHILFRTHPVDPLDPNPFGQDVPKSPPNPKLVEDHNFPPSPPAPKSSLKKLDHTPVGEWWLTRTGQTPKCVTCKREIPKHAFRLVYAPAPPKEYLGKAPSYLHMHNKIARFCHHIHKDCVPPPSKNCEEVFGERSLTIDVASLPIAAKESAESRRLVTAEAVSLALNCFAHAGHNIVE